MKVYKSIDEVNKASVERFRQSRLRKELQKTLAGENTTDVDMTLEEARAKLQKTLADKDTEDTESFMSRNELTARWHKTLSGGR